MQIYLARPMCCYGADHQRRAIANANANANARRNKRRNKCDNFMRLSLAHHSLDFKGVVKNGDRSGKEQ